MLGGDASVPAEAAGAVLGAAILVTVHAPVARLAQVEPPVAARTVVGTAEAHALHAHKHVAIVARGGRVVSRAIARAEDGARLAWRVSGGESAVE